MSYYKDKQELLEEIFGEKINLYNNKIQIGKKTYKIVDDVIIFEAIKDDIKKLDVINSFGEEWNEFKSITQSHYDEFDSYFNDVDIQRLKGKIVADFGAGIGRWSYILSKKVLLKSIIISDASDAIFVARNNLREIENAIFLKFDIDQCPIKKEIIDFGFCLGVLHHLPYDLKDLQLCINNIYDCCKENLYYVYWKFDQRSKLFKSIYYISNELRLFTIKIKNYSARKILSHILTLFVYYPFILINRFFNFIGLPIKNMPLVFYTNMNYSRIRQDAYDKYFTLIEYRYSKKDLNKIFLQKYRVLRFSNKIPHWTFLAIKKKPLFLKTSRKILFITSGFNDGGAQKIIKQLVSIRDADLDLKYLCIGQRPVNQSINKKIIFTENKIRYSFKKSLNVVDEFQPDIIVSTITNIDIFVFILSFFSNIKFKHIIRNSVVMTSHYSQFMIYPIFKRIIRYYYSKVDRFICMSDDMINDLVKNYHIDREKISKIPNFIEINKVNLPYKKKKIEENTFICIGRIHKQKGYDILIESLKFSKKNFSISIYGWGSESLLIKYKKMIKYYKLEHCIRFMGRKKIDLSLLSNYDALILPSRYEGFPNVALEALSAGLPILSLPFKGGINEIIIAKKNGEIADSMSSQSLAKLILNFNRNDYKRSTILSSISKFEKNKILNLYTQLFKNV